MEKVYDKCCGVDVSNSRKERSAIIVSAILISDSTFRKTISSLCSIQRDPPVDLYHTAIRQRTMDDIHRCLQKLLQTVLHIVQCQQRYPRRRKLQQQIDIAPLGIIAVRIRAEELRLFDGILLRCHRHAVCDLFNTQHHRHPQYCALY